MLNTELLAKIDIDKPLILSPKTFIGYGDKNYFTIGLCDEDDAIKFVTNLLTVVYSFGTPTTPADLITVWPPENTNDLLNAISTLKDANILITEDAFTQIEETLTPTNEFVRKEFEDDKVWLFSHLKAFKGVPDDAMVLNLGAKGAGYLAQALAKKNVKKIVAINPDYPSTLLSKKYAKEAQIDKIDFINCKPFNMSSICYSDKFNVLLTELFCPGIMDERILESVIYAKKHLLTDDCIYIPEGFTIKTFAYNSVTHRDMVQESREFEVLYGLKFDSFSQAMENHLMGIFNRLDTKEITRLSEDQPIRHVEFKNLKTSYFTEEIEIKLTESGIISGFCIFFEANLPGGDKVTNSPYALKTKFMQRVFVTAAKKYYQKGESITLKIVYDGNLNVSIVEQE